MELGAIYCLAQDTPYLLPVPKFFLLCFPGIRGALMECSGEHVILRIQPTALGFKVCAPLFFQLLHSSWHDRQLGNLRGVGGSPPHPQNLAKNKHSLGLC